jgi:hypothetical protein
MRKVGRTTRAQIVYANNPVALRKQSVDKGGADESGSAGDQDTHFTNSVSEPGLIRSDYLCLRVRMHGAKGNTPPPCAAVQTGRSGAQRLWIRRDAGALPAQPRFELSRSGRGTNCEPGQREDTVRLELNAFIAARQR